MPSFIRSLASMFSSPAASSTSLDQVASPPAVPAVIAGPTGIAMPETVDPTETMGVGVAQFIGGYLASRETNPELVGRARYRTYLDTVINIEIAAAGIRMYHDLLRGVEWSFAPPAPYKDDPEAIQMAEDVSQLVHMASTTWSEIVGNVARFRHWDFSISEWSLRKIEEGPLAGWLGIGYVEVRENETIEQWIPDENGRIVGIVQRSPMDFKLRPIPRAKLIYRADQTFTSSPDGIGIIRHIVRAKEQVLRFEDIEMIGFDGNLRGTPIAYIPYVEIAAAVKANLMSAKEAKDSIDAMKSIVQNHVVSRGRGVAVDSSPFRSLDVNGTPSAMRMWDLKTVTTEAGSQKELGEAIRRKREDVAIVCYAEVLLLATGGGGGSHAAAVEKGTRMANLINGTAGEVGETVRQDLLMPLMALNGKPVDKTPVPTASSVTGFDVKEAADIITAQAQSGQPLRDGDPAIDLMRTRGGLPAIPPEVIARAEQAAMLQRRAMARVVPGATDPNAPPSKDPNKPPAPAPRKEPA